MKTNEFIKAVEELGYLVDDGYGYWQIWSEKNPIIAVVNKIDLSRISTDFVAWCNISDEDKNKILDLIIKYSKTPIEDREEEKEKRYYLKHRWLQRYGKSNYLNIEAGGNYYGLNDIRDLEYVQTKFTLNEIEEIKEKFYTDLSDFELVEVEE